MRYMIWTTDTCNLRCDYCYEQKSILPNGILSFRTRENILRFITNDAGNIESITFHGAEPLMGFDFIRNIVEHLYKLNPTITYGFTTNGTFLNHTIEDFLGCYQSVFTEISVSIDGTESSHDINRKYKDGSGSYRTVKDNAIKLLKIFPDLRGRMTVTSNNIHNLYDNIVSIHELGINTIVPSINYYDEQWDDVCFDSLTTQLEKIRCYCSRFSKLSVSIFDEIRSKRVLGKCVFSYNIYVDGNIYPCVYAVNNKELVLGNVVEGVDKSRHDYLCKLNNVDNEFCTECTNKEFCINNRCKYMNFSITGDMYLPSRVGCQFEHYKLLLSKNAPEVFS